MSGMNEYLAAFYGTTGATSPELSGEDVEKQAQVELFYKLASENNIDIAKLSDAEVTGLWDQFQKNASEDGPPMPPEKKDEEHDKKVEKAKEEHEEKKEAAAKIAEADFLGRTMAHAYVDELKKIAAATTPETPAAVETPATETKEAAMPEFLRKGMEAAKHHAGGAVAKGKEVAGKALEHGKKHPGATHGAAAAGGAAAGAAAMHKKEKKASALDELACASALQKVAEAQMDVEEAATRLGAVLQLPVSENSKVAGVETLDQAIDLRSLELLELAGYPITWNQ